MGFLPFAASVKIWTSACPGAISCGVREPRQWEAGFLISLQLLLKVKVNEDGVVRAILFVHLRITLPRKRNNTTHIIRRLFSRNELDARFFFQSAITLSERNFDYGTFTSRKCSLGTADKFHLNEYEHIRKNEADPNLRDSYQFYDIAKYNLSHSEFSEHPCR